VALIARYLVDTSVLARMSQPAVAAPVLPLIEAGLVGTCAALDMEALYGARTAVEYEEIRRDRIRSYENLPTDDEHWARALDVQRALAARGQLRAVGVADLVIAAIAEQHGVTLIHYDGDFDHVVAITGQPARWVVARGSVS